MNKKLFRYIGLGLCLIVLVCCLFQIASGSTVIIYPIMDGQIVRAPSGAGYNMTYTNASMKAGTTASLTGTTGIIGAYTSTATTSPNFSQVNRLYYTFDLSVLPQNVQLTGAYLRTVCSAKTVTLGAPNIAIIDFNPANKLTYVADDYNKTNLIPYSDYLLSGNINVGYENIIPFNSAGLTLINNTIATRYLSVGLGSQWDINQSDSPTGLLWGLSRSAIYTMYLSEQTDTINDPYLLLVYSNGASTTINTNLTFNGTTIVYNNFTSINNITFENENQEEFYGNLNYYFLMIIIVVFIVLAIAYNSLFGYAGIVLSIGGLAVSIDKGFYFALAYVILLIISALIAFDMGD